MSYDVSLVDPKTKRSVIVDNHSEGGTYAIGGTDEADLNITWNYGKYFHSHINKKKGIRWLYNKKAKRCIRVLKRAVEELGTMRSNDYWEATSGNAGYALNILLSWAKQHPKAVFTGD